MSDSRPGRSNARRWKQEEGACTLSACTAIMLKRDQYYDRLLVVNGIPLTILALQAYPSYTATERFVVPTMHTRTAAHKHPRATTVQPTPPTKRILALSSFFWGEGGSATSCDLLLNCMHSAWVHLSTPPGMFHLPWPLLWFWFWRGED